MRISIVIPAYNEADTISSILSELEEYMNAYVGEEGWEIIVVNDGSTDNTIEVLKKLQQLKTWLKVIDLVFNQGRGKALRTGIENSSGGIIVSLDADLSYAPYHIERLIEKMESENADIVLASAYGKGGSVRKVPFKRLLISKLGNRILSYMAGSDLTVLTCIVRAYKKAFIEQLDLHSNDKEIHLEIINKARMLGGKIVEIPADLHWRESKLSTPGMKQDKRRSTLKIKRTSSSHIFFALLGRPGIIFWIPGYILLSVFLYVFVTIIFVVMNDVSSGISLYLAIRNSMLHAAPSWLSSAVSLVLGVQFFTLGFLTNQSKRNYEETYRTLSAIYSRLQNNK